MTPFDGPLDGFDGGFDDDFDGLCGQCRPGRSFAWFVFALCLVFFLAVGCGRESSLTGWNASPAGGTAVPHSPTGSTYGKLPLSFEANHGQADTDVRFLARGSGYTLFLSPAFAVLELREPASDPAADTEDRRPAVAPVRESVRFRMQLVGANPDPVTSGLDELPGKVNYFIGNDSAKWRTNIPTYASVRHKDVYPGIDQVYYGKGGELEYDFVVAPGSDPDLIRVRIDGSEPLRQDSMGNLILESSPAKIQMLRPVIYQEVAGRRMEVPGEYRVLDQSEIGFRVGEFDRSLPLVIDPVLSYSTFLDSRSGNAIAVDTSGNAYVTGSDGSGDAFVARLNASGSALVYFTTLGSGSGGTSIAVDGEQNAYVAGATSLTAFPTTANAFQTSLAGARDVFVVKLDATGSTLLYSTFLGSSGDDTASDIAVDGEGNAYLTGTTNSPGFPTENPFEATYSDGDRDGFVTKLNASGSALSYSTYLGGDGIDQGLGIAVDGEGNAYVTGQTRSGTFPLVNALQPGSFFTTVTGDAFVTKFDASGSQLVYSTFFGGTKSDLGRSIVADSAGNAYVAGWTASDDFLTVNPVQETLNGFSDAFVTKFNPSGSELLYSTYFGGNGPDTAQGIGLDSEGNVYVIGDSASTDFPTLEPVEVFSAATTTHDSYLAKFGASGSLVYATPFGGGDDDDGMGIAVDSSGNAYVTGKTVSSDFPTVEPLLGAFGGSQAAFVFRVDGTTPAGQPFSVADRGGTSITSAGSSASLGVGYARIEVDATGTTPSGIAIFGLRQNGVRVTEAGVPAVPLRNTGRIYAEVAGAANTGVAIANPNAQTANISFFFTGADGVNFGTDSFELGANQQTAKFLDQEPFKGEAPLNGSFTFVSDVPVAVVALRGFTNERGEFLITTLPVATVGSTSSDTLFFPHFADGGGWTTQIVLVNPSDATIGGTLEFFDQSGDAVVLGVEGQTGSSFPYSVAPRTSQRFRTAGSAETVRVGAASVTPTSGVAPSGLAVFSFKNNNTTVSESGVPALPAGTAFRMYAEASGSFGDVGSIQTGVAIANPASTEISLSFELSDLNGTSSGLTGAATVPGRGQVALFLNQVQGFETLSLPFSGVLRISTGAATGVSVVGLRGRYNERDDFLITTVPPVDESGTSTSAEFFFPHFADGDGYTTQFILFAGLAGQTTSGTMRFSNTSGEAISLPVQ